MACWFAANDMPKKQLFRYGAKFSKDILNFKSTTKSQKISCKLQSPLKRQSNCNHH